MLVEPRQVRIKWDLPCWYWNNIINNLQLIWCKEHNNMAVVFMLDLWKSIDLVFGVYKPGQLHITGVHKTMDPPSTFPGDHAFLHSWNDFSTHGIPMFGVSSHVSSKSNWFFLRFIKWIYSPFRPSRLRPSHEGQYPHPAVLSLGLRRGWLCPVVGRGWNRLNHLDTNENTDNMGQSYLLYDHCVSVYQYN